MVQMLEWSDKDLKASTITTLPKVEVNTLERMEMIWNEWKNRGLCREI